MFYEATTKVFPSWFLISSTLTGARTQTGLNIRIELPHVVYMLQPQPLRRADVAVHAFEFDTVAKRVRVELENTRAHQLHSSTRCGTISSSASCRENARSRRP